MLRIYTLSLENWTNLFFPKSKNFERRIFLGSSICSQEWSSYSFKLSDFHIRFLYSLSLFENQMNLISLSKLIFYYDNMVKFSYNIVKYKQRGQ